MHFHLVREPENCYKQWGLWYRIGHLLKELLKIRENFREATSALPPSRIIVDVTHGVDLIYAH